MTELILLPAILSPLIFIYLVFSAVRSIFLNSSEFASKFNCKSAKTLFLSTRLIDLSISFIWILCLVKAVEPYHDPALVNYVTFTAFALISLIIRQIAHYIVEKHSLKFQYSIDLIINFIAFIKLSEYAYRAIKYL